MVRTSLALILAIVFALSLCIGCEGPEGPQGPTGATGPEGPPGPGTRTVYTGLVPTGSDYYEVSVAEVDLSDMPNIGVYGRFVGKAAGRQGGEPRAMQGGWMELPYSWTDGTYIYFHYAYFVTGQVIFEFCNGMEYRIVVVE